MQSSMGLARLARSTERCTTDRQSDLYTSWTSASLSKCCIEWLVHSTYRPQDCGRGKLMHQIEMSFVNYPPLLVVHHCSWWSTSLKMCELIALHQMFSEIRASSRSCPASPKTPSFQRLQDCLRCPSMHKQVIQAISSSLLYELTVFCQKYISKSVNLNKVKQFQKADLHVSRGTVREREALTLRFHQALQAQ